MKFGISSGERKICLDQDLKAREAKIALGHLHDEYPVIRIKFVSANRFRLFYPLLDFHIDPDAGLGNLL